MDLLFLLTIVPAFLVGSFFIKHDPGPEEPKSAIHSAVWFGVAAIGLALLFSFIFNLILSGDVLGRISGVENASQLPLYLDVLIFATIEEIVKFIPVAVYLLRKDFFNEMTDGIIYFAIVGLTFGGIESFLYGFTSGDLGAVVAIVRLALGLFFHGALTSVVGYYFVRAKVLNKGILPALMALLGVSLIHAGYNFFVYSAQNDPIFIFGAAAIAIVTNATMFWLYFVATKKDLKLGLAGPEFQQQNQAAEEQRRAVRQQEYQASQSAQPAQQTIPVQSVPTPEESTEEKPQQ